MVHIYIRGRLGNQLFQYAFARKIQEENPDIKLCYHFDEVYSQGKQVDGWENSLQWFNTKGIKDVTGLSEFLPKLNILQRLVLRLYWRNFPHNKAIDIKNKYQKKWVRYLSKIGLYYLDLGYFDFPAIKQKECLISGNFESEKYFINIKDKIKQEITPIQAPLKTNHDFLEKIKTTNSICISIRRGDYISNLQFSKIHNICNKSYYLRAIDKIATEVENPVFFFFSDDIEWVRNNIKLPYESYYETGNDPVWEKLRLMSSCKHFIISNSTFSWWAQYLGDYEKKVVVAPEKWYNNPLQSELYMDNWILIPVQE